MTKNDLLMVAPKILDQLMREFIRSGDREYQKDPKSQTSACFSLAIRSTSLLVGMAKYYWTGATPTAQAIRDISSKGLYVVTQERWYPGTLVLFTLQRTDTEDGIGQCSIRVYTRAVRKGKDGVGLQFVLPETKDRVAEGKSLIGSVTKKGLETFLKGLRVAKC
jgi:PilZ domain